MRQCFAYDNVHVYIKQ